MTRARILLVDDDQDFRDVLRLALEGAGYEVFDAPNGLRALAKLDEVVPDLVLLDVNMPVMSGAEFVGALRQRGDVHSFGIVALSGSINARSSPTKWFLQKPVKLDLLLSVVADFCGRQRRSPVAAREQREETLNAIAEVMPAPRARS